MARSSGRTAGAGALLLVLVAAVCAVLRAGGGGGGGAATGMLQAAAPDAAPDAVFTSQDSAKIFRGLSHYEAGREAAFERKIEALRRQSAHEHAVHEQALAANEAQGEKRVRTLDARRLPAVFDARDAAAQMRAAAKEAAAHEQKLQARISQYEQQDSAAHRTLETHLEADSAKSRAREAKIAAHAEQQAAESVLKPALQVREQEDAVKYADAREQSFEASVSKYRKAARHSVEKYKATVQADEKAHAPEMHTLVQHALAHGVAASGGQNRDTESRAQRSPKAAAPEKSTSHAAGVVGGTRDAMLGVAGEEKALKAEEQREIARQKEFKNRVKEESQKAASEQRLRQKAALDALHEMHVQAAARHAQEEAKRAAWKKKREERQAVQKVLASMGNDEWPSV